MQLRYIEHLQFDAGDAKSGSRSQPETWLRHVRHHPCNNTVVKAGCWCARTSGAACIRGCLWEWSMSGDRSGMLNTLPRIPDLQKSAAQGSAWTRQDSRLGHGRIYDLDTAGFIRGRTARACRHFRMMVGSYAYSADGYVDSSVPILHMMEEVVCHNVVVGSGMKIGEGFEPPPC